MTLVYMCALMLYHRNAQCVNIKFTYYYSNSIQDCTDNSSTNKVEILMERQKHYDQFENKADALPRHVQLSVRF